jgi:hypothetical protein
MIAENCKAREDVSYFTIPFKYCFSIGTPDSIEFLYKFSNSPVDKFVTSHWKEIIFYKWRQQIYFHIFNSLLYWVYTILTTLSLIFYRDKDAFKYACIVIICFFALYEIIQVISFCGFSLKKYLYFLINLLDTSAISGII